MKTKDLFSFNRSPNRLNESLSKTFGKKLNLETFDLEQLHDARNKLRTQVSQIRDESGFNENLENDAYHQAQWMLDAINAEIAERDEQIIEADVEEGQSDVDYELHQIARSDDEEELIDAMEGLKGAELQIALEDMMDELKDELASKGMNDVMRDEDKMIEMLMDKIIEEYGEDGEEYDDGGETDDDYALKSAGFGSDEDYESIQYEDRVDEKAVSKAQQRAAGIALSAKRKGETPAGKGAAAEMAKMSTKELEKYAGTKHKNLPAKKDESTEEGIISTPAKLIGKTIGGVSKAAGAIAGVPGGIARAFRKGKKRSRDVISGDDEDRNRKESVQRGDKMTRLREGEVQQASAIVTAKTMVDRVGRWIEELSGMENETLLQLGDSIRDEMGQEQSRAFIEQVAPAIQQALETLKGTRETISNGVNTLATGEMPADMLGAESPPMPGEEEMGAAEPDAMNAEEPMDDFAAAEPAAGPDEAGREQRESIQYQNRLLKVLAG
jgi:hypothetical protein